MVSAQTSFNVPYDPARRHFSPASRTQTSSPRCIRWQAPPSAGLHPGFNRARRPDPRTRNPDRLKVINGEAVWQSFFEENTWIFGYGLTLLACEKYGEDKLEQVTSGWNAFTGGGKRSDALMRTKGFVQTLLFAEIKKHDTPLLMMQQYRKPDVYQVSRELSGAVSQVQKTAYKALSRLGALHASRTPEGKFEFEISTIRPRQIVIIGNLAQLADGQNINVEKMTTFELYRRDHQEVEILTFDELYERSRYIVEHHEEKRSDAGS